MQALLKAPIGKAHVVDELTVDMLARTGGKLIKVQTRNRGAAVFAVDRYRLFDSADRSRRITEEEFRRLPWQGKGDDPDKGASGDLLAKARIEEAMTGRGQ